MNTKKFLMLTAFCVCCIVIGLCIGVMTKTIINDLQRDEISKRADLEARKQVASLSETTKEIFTISIHGEDARIIRFTAVDGEDPELILETTLEMKELLNQLILIGFWELQVTSPGNENIISVDFKKMKISKKTTV